MRSLLLSLTALVLSGCASLDTTLVNKDGQRYRCSASGYGIIGSTVAQSRFDDCIARAEDKGYKK